MSFEALGAARSGGAACHAIVNGWEHFRITPLAEASGASWSVGPYWYPLKRRRLNPLVLGRMMLEVIRVSLDLLRVSRRVRPTHIFLPDYQGVLRNALALLWLRARGVRVIARLGNAPATGRFYTLLWRQVIDPSSTSSSRIPTSPAVSCWRSGSVPRRYRRSPICRPGGRRRGTRTVRGSPAGSSSLAKSFPKRDSCSCWTPWPSCALVGWRRRSTSSATWTGGSRRRTRVIARRFERAPRSTDLDGVVNFLGWREDVPALLSRAALHCCPSRMEQREAFGNVVLEAKMAGIPSVVTMSGDLPDLVAHRETGWVCHDTGAEALAQGLEYFLTRPEELSRAGSAALRSAGEYSPQRFASAWIAAFDLPSERHDPCGSLISN